MVPVRFLDQRLRSPELVLSMSDEQQAFDGMEDLYPEGASAEYIKMMLEAMRETLAAARHNTRVLEGRE